MTSSAAQLRSDHRELRNRGNVDVVGGGWVGLEGKELVNLSCQDAADLLLVDVTGRQKVVAVLTNSLGSCHRKLTRKARPQ